MTCLKIFLELSTFLIENKRWWLVPMFAVLILFAILFLVSQASVIAPFIYTLF